jgi:DNA-binding XRE family transcriptional regulator
MAESGRPTSSPRRSKGGNTRPNVSAPPAAEDTNSRKRIYSTPSPETSLVSNRESLANDLVAVFGENLRAARLRSDLTQAEIADRLGITQQYLSLIEKGRKNVTLRTMMALADVLGADVSDMLRRPRSRRS